jgi:hypothetical protein
MIRFPRTSEDLVVVQGTLWNRLVDEVERQGRLTVAPPLRLQDVPGGRLLTVAMQQAGFWVWPTGHTQDGTNKRWKYDWASIENTGSGYGGWTAASGGLTGSSSTWDYLYNSIENSNAATGTFGNGVSSTNLTGSFDIQPIPNNTPLFARVVIPKVASAKPQLWVEYPNGINGACS